VSGPVDLVVSGGVATVTLNTPENRNAISLRLRTALAESLDAAIADAAVKVIVLTGEGPVFCSGADLKEGSTALSEGPSLTGIFTNLMEGPKPSVAVLNGPARAGGIGLVAACDMAIAPDTATFAFSEVRIGVIPAIISVPCLAVLEPRFAARYFLTGELFDAATARDAGLLTGVAPPDSVHAARDEIVGALMEGAPAALAGTKRLLREMRGLPRAVAFSYAERVSAVFFAGDDAAEGRRAFAEKRPPAWSPRAT
jgi:enoyl-CoA hydratase/carnithine racemase